MEQHRLRFKIGIIVESNRVLTEEEKDTLFGKLDHILPLVKEDVRLKIKPLLPPGIKIVKWQINYSNRSEEVDEIV